MISQQLIQQWEEYGLSTNQDCATPCNAYIQGRTDQYLQMQAEIERLKGLVEAAYRGMMTEFFESRDNDTDILTLVDENWQRYKQHHNL